MERKDLRILYMGTPEMSAAVLRKTVELGYRVVAVVTQEDKPVGRKGIMEPSPVKQAALSYGIPVYTPHRIRKDYEWAKELSFDIILTFAYGQIVPEEFLNLAPKGAYNLHGSILPKYRGAAPIQRAIMAGESKTGLSLMRMVKEMDAGGVFDIRETEITTSDDYGSLCQKLSILGESIVKEDLIPLIEGKLPEIPQDTTKVTFANKILPEEERIPVETLGNKPAFDYLRGLAPTPGGYVYFEGRKLKLLRCGLSSVEVPAGEFRRLGKKLFLGCESGSLELLQVQLEGKKETDGASFLNGHQNIPSL